MNEVKTPKKPFVFYYIIVLLALMLINFLAVPGLMQASIIEVDYGTFMSMTEEKDIGQVEIEDNQILFTNKEGTQIYKTGLMDDPERTQRLYDSGASSLLKLWSRHPRSSVFWCPGCSRWSFLWLSDSSCIREP